VTYWAPPTADFLSHAEQAKNLTDLAVRVQAPGPQAVASWWRRQRKRDENLPVLKDVLGSKRRDDWGEYGDTWQTDDDPPPAKMVYPPGTKAPPRFVENDVTAAVTGSIVCISDLHIPIEDKTALLAVIAFLRDLRPEHLVLNGDIYDLYSVSSYEKEAGRVGDRLQAEFDAALPYWQVFTEVAKHVHYTPGNHENRLSRLINANPGLFGLKALEWKHLAGIPASVNVYGYGTRLKIGNVDFVHGDRLGAKGPPKHGTSWVLDNFGSRNTVYGHTHKLMLTCRPFWTEDGAHQNVAINSGHLSDTLAQTYAHEPHWTTGFVSFETWSEAGKPRFTPHLFPIIGGAFSYGGRVYSGRKLQ